MSEAPPAYVCDACCMSRHGWCAGDECACYCHTPPADECPHCRSACNAGHERFTGCYECDQCSPPADVCPGPDVKPYGQQRLDGFFCRTCGAEFGPDQSGKAEAHGKPPAEVCPECGSKMVRKLHQLKKGLPPFCPSCGGTDKTPHQGCAPDICMIQQGPCPIYTEQERGTGDRPAVSCGACWGDYGDHDPRCERHPKNMRRDQSAVTDVGGWRWCENVDRPFICRSDCPGPHHPLTVGTPAVSDAKVEAALTAYMADLSLSQRDAMRAALEAAATVTRAD